MIISHRLQFCAFRSPKTAGNTLMLVMYLSGLFDDQDILTGAPVLGFTSVNVPDGEHWRHNTPQQAIDLGLITKAQLEAYTCVAVLRDPMDRYRSAYTHSEWQTGAVQTEIKRHKDLGILNRPVVDYFHVDGIRVCDPILFSDFDNEIRRVMADLGGPTFPVIPRINTTEQKLDRQLSDFLDASSQALVAQALKPDIDFFNSIVGS